MATLNVWNYFSVAANGVEVTGKHGAATDSPQTPLGVSVTGLPIQFAGQLAAMATDSIDLSLLPNDGFDYLHFSADVVMWLQLYNGVRSSAFKVAAETPFVLPFNSMRFDSGYTPLTGTEPIGVALSVINVGNYTAGTGKYVLTLVD